MSETSDILFQLAISFDGEKYYAALDIPNSYRASGNTPLRAVMNWVFGIQHGIKRYREGEITFEYFVARLGIPEEIARQILDNEEILQLSDQRVKLDRLYKLDQGQSPINSNDQVFYTEEGLQRLAQIVRSARSNKSYREMEALTNVAHGTLRRIELLDVSSLNVLTLQRLAPATGYSYQELMAIVQI